MRLAHPSDAVAHCPRAARALAAAVVRRDHARAADDLAAALRRAVQEGGRDSRLPRRLVPALPHAGSGRDERALRRRLERDGADRRDRPRDHGPLPRHAGLARRARRARAASTRPSSSSCRRSSSSLVAFAAGTTLLRDRPWRSCSCCRCCSAARSRRLSNAMALVTRQEESLIGAVQFVVLPASFLSSGMMASNLLPGLDSRRCAVQPGELGSHRGALVRLVADRGARRFARRAHARVRLARDACVPRVPAGRLTCGGAAQLVGVTR